MLDSSGKSLHALVSNFTGTLRQDASNDALSQMLYEKLETCAVLFPAYPDTVTLNTTLLTSATLYDAANPNLITRLIPAHYLLEGAIQDGTADVADDHPVYGGSGMPGQGQMTPAQIIVSFLYIYARFFDEMKLYIDAFSSLRYLDYAVKDNIPNNFLYDLVHQYGFHLPPLFNDSNIDQYINAENIGYEIATSAYPLKAVQNELMRRVLINMPDVIRSKGTQHAIKSFLRAVGIDPDNSMRIREFGGPTTRQLTFSREKKREPNVMVNFITSSLAVSPFLSASRVEVGFPVPRGTMISKDIYPPHGISDQPSDGLLTSGSWMFEGIYKYTPSNCIAMTSMTQSLARMCVTGTMGVAYVANLLAISSSIDSKLLLYIRPGESTSSLLRMELPMAHGGIFDYARWNVSFGCERNDAIDSLVSSSYFLRVGTQSDGEITQYQSTSSFFQESIGSNYNAFRDVGADSASGSFIAIGENQIAGTGSSSSYVFLNNTVDVPDEARATNFTGRVSNVRFWSYAPTDNEWKEHIRNYKSLGVTDPLVNYNFVTTRSGSWERVRFDTMTKQLETTANATASLGPLGSITFLDFSLNTMHLTGTGFPTDTKCMVGELFDYSYLSPYFDEATSNEKVRVRGYLDQDLIDSTPWAATAPVHEIVKSESPTDDTRFAIDFSLIDALNRDIVTLFSTFDAIDNALGSPELMYSPDYPDLARMRDVYFNRISTRLNFQGFFEFFRWFDDSLGMFIEQLMPRKTKYKGTNYVIESHMLERNKFEYPVSEMYLDEGTRKRIDDTLLLQQIVGSIRKF